MSWRLLLQEPFGLLVEVDPGTRWEDLGHQRLRAWLEEHLVVVIRGLPPPAKAELPGMARGFGRIQSWSFGAVNDLCVQPDAVNYLYTSHAVPLHWDGAFARRVPATLFFHCVQAPPADAGGATRFVDTRRVWEAADDASRQRWRSVRCRYRTERLAHYGGSFETDLVHDHPLDGGVVLRFAEPVDDRNPVQVEALGPGADSEVVAELSRACADPNCSLRHAWRDGDLLLADNLRLLHGREAFTREAPRHLRRVNCLPPDPRPWRRWLVDALVLRRPEFWIAEIPILLIPMVLVASAEPGIDATALLLAGLLFVACFHVGDLANCLHDRDLDAVYKSRLSEAVYALGLRQVRLQLTLSAGAALVLGLALGLRQGHWLPTLLLPLGLAWSWQYSAPPLRLKGRGWWQGFSLWGLIFVGPMLMTAWYLAGPPAPLVIGVAVGYGLMQTGLVLLNTVEDLPEDRAAGVANLGVVLGARGGVACAAIAITVGGAGLALLLAWWGRDLALRHQLLGALPFAAAWTWCAAATLRLWTRCAGRGEAELMPLIRAAGRRMPLWITLTAWTSLWWIWLTSL